MSLNGAVKMTHSKVLSKKGRSFVAVMFELEEKSAEGTIPECVIIRNSGFSEEEIEGLENYMEEHKEEILESAKSISGIMNIFG